MRLVSPELSQKRALSLIVYSNCDSQNMHEKKRNAEKRTQQHIIEQDAAQQKGTDT